MQQGGGGGSSHTIFMTGDKHGRQEETVEREHSSSARVGWGGAGRRHAKILSSHIYSARPNGVNSPECNECE